MYKEFAETAREEGFDQIANLFEMVGEIEKHHEELKYIIWTGKFKKKLFVFFRLDLLIYNIFYIMYLLIKIFTSEKQIHILCKSSEERRI
mgnify:CR=1 FL=1